MSEHELFATVDYHCRMLGGDHLAYPPVVAGGERANIIHYITNNQHIQPDEMVLMDAGELGAFYCLCALSSFKIFISDRSPCFI